MKNNLEYIFYICYYSSHYVYRYLSHHPWWQNLYTASAARVVSRPRQGPPPHDCESQSLFRRGDRGDALGTAPQGGPGASGDHPGRDHVATRDVFWCCVDCVPRRPTFGDRTGPGHDTLRETGAVASDRPRHRSRLATLGRASGDGACRL